MRRFLLLLLWTSIAALLLSAYLWQQEKQDTDNANSLNAGVSGVLGAPAAPAKTPDYTVAYAVGLAGLGGVVVAGTSLKRSAR